MSHAFPIAATLDDALKADAPAARTRAEAEALSAGRAISGLVTDWLTLDAEGVARLLATEFVAARGHLQRYEDEAGRPVLALSWWKLAPLEKDTKRKPAKAPKKAAPPADPPPTEDHTDDLYFRSGRTKTKKKKSEVDRNQLGLFDGLNPDSN
jgi:hypothetical protein